MKLNKRRKICLVLIALFACALTFAGLKGWSSWKKKTDFVRKVDKMRALVYSFYEICSIFERKDAPIIDNYMAFNTRDKALGSWRMGCLYHEYKIDCGGTTAYKRIEGGEDFGKRYHPFKSWNEEPNYSYHLDYLCKNDDPRSPHYNEASVMTIVGDDTAFNNMQKIHDASVFDSKINENFSPSAILFIEAVDSGIHWGQPGDFDLETVSKEQLFPGDTEGILIVFSDWDIWYIENSVPMETLKHFMTVKSSKEHDREKELSPYGRKIRNAG